MSNDILKGIRVVELGTHVAIPYCARELADMGADVIKIEPITGETYRTRIGMLFQLPYEKENNTVFIPYNANKRSLPLNLKDEDSKEVFLKLLETADIFLTNTRENALERLGLGLETLRKKFPKLIIGSINGFGRKGEFKDRGGYDATSFWSPSGALPEWMSQDSRVFKPFYGFGDAVTSGQLSTGIMSALYRREKTGEGDIVRVSLLATGLWTNVCGLLRYQNGHKFPKNYYDPLLPLDNFYLTKDGKWFLSSEERWDLRCGAYFELFGTPELMDDPEWSTLRGYVTNIPEKVKFIEEHIAQVTSEEITEKLSKVGAIFEFLRDTDDVLTNQQAWDNEYLRTIKTANGKDLTLTNIPIEFESQSFIDEIKTAPQLGQDSVSILEELGYEEEKIQEMAEKKAVVLG